mgnify:CR=1 FL=1
MNLNGEEQEEVEEGKEAGHNYGELQWNFLVTDVTTVFHNA